MYYNNNSIRLVIFRCTFYALCAPESSPPVLGAKYFNIISIWFIKVGIPAKSGVSGNMVLVVPNVMGIALWSPPLCPLGNSVRGVAFAEVRVLDGERNKNILAAIFHDIQTFFFRN